MGVRGAGKRGAGSRVSGQDSGSGFKRPLHPQGCDRGERSGPPGHPPGLPVPASCSGSRPPAAHSQGFPGRRPSPAPLLPCCLPAPRLSAYRAPPPPHPLLLLLSLLALPASSPQTPSSQLLGSPRLRRQAPATPSSLRSPACTSVPRRRLPHRRATCTFHANPMACTKSPPKPVWLSG